MSDSSIFLKFKIERWFKSKLHVNSDKNWTNPQSTTYKNV